MKIRSSCVIKCSPMKSTSLKFLHLSLRYDPNVDIPMDVDGQNDRVIFIKSVAQFMVCILFDLTNETVSFGAMPRYINQLSILYFLLGKSVPLYLGSEFIHRIPACRKMGLKGLGS